MPIQPAIRRLLLNAGWYVQRRKNLPSGIDWALDFQRRVKGLSPTMIFDVGANVGQTTSWLRSEFPLATIHAFEPIPSTFKTLSHNVRTLANVELHQIACGAETRSTQVQAIPNNLQNSLTTGIFDDHPDAQPVDVEVRTIDGICTDLKIDRIDILKMDTEGYDLAVIDGATEMIRSGRVSAVVSEVTFDSEDSLHTSFYDAANKLGEMKLIACGLYETETLFRTGDGGSYCNALVVHRELLEKCS